MLAWTESVAVVVMLDELTADITIEAGEKDTKRAMYILPEKAITKMDITIRNFKMSFLQISLNVLE